MRAAHEVSVGWASGVAVNEGAFRDATPRATVRLAERHKLTAYDAAYLELAQRRGLPLATLDAELRSAASAEGILLLGSTSERE